MDLSSITAMLFSITIGSMIFSWILLKVIVLHNGLGAATDRKIRTCCVLGSGGHTAEMLKLIKNLEKNRYGPRTYFIAETDKFSLDKLKDYEIDLSDSDVHIQMVPRSREVGQSYLTSIFSTMKSMIYCFPLVLASQPQLLLVNGPGTCIPLAFIVWLLTKINVSRCKIIFIESICRVKTLSLTGNIMQFLADELLVQWPELANKYPRTKYIGKFL